MIYILNTPILTEYGEYDFHRISIDDVKTILIDGFTSAVGHEGTASFMSRIFGIAIPLNRTAIKMQFGDEAIVFRLLARLPEGTILSEEDLTKVPYEIGILRRLA